MLPSISRSTLAAISIVAGTLFLGAFGISCGGSQKVLIGAVLPLTGDNAVYGEEIQRGIQIALEQLKRDRGFTQLTVEVVDSASDDDTARRQVEALYSKGARAVIGGVTASEAMAMAQVAEANSRVLLSPSASTPEIQQASRYFYRIWPSFVREGTVMGQYAADKLCKTAVVLVAETPYTQDVERVFEEAFREKGGEILQVLQHHPDVDHQLMVEQLVSVGADCIYISDYADEVGQTLRLLDQVGYDGSVLTLSTFASPKVIAAIGEPAEWVYLTHPAYDPADETNPVLKSFVQAYQEEYGGIPGAFAAHGYDAMLLMAEAVAAGGNSGADFWKGMRGLREVQGVTGILQFDEMGDVQKFPRVYFILEGRLRDHQAYEQERAEQLRREIEELRRQRERMIREGRAGG
jgi:branched-chain amino acid transport system substrate-binding protein